MKGNAKYTFLTAAFVAAYVAFFSAQYLIGTFFPDLTLIDLGTFYVLGFISGLFVGLFLAFSRRGLLATSEIGPASNSGPILPQ